MHDMVDMGIFFFNNNNWKSHSVITVMGKNIIKELSLFGLTH